MSQPILNPAPLDALAEDLGDPVVVAAMLSAFCDSLQSLRAAAEDGWTAHDPGALRGTLRDLSATAAMFGAERLARTSRDLADRVGDREHDVTLESLLQLEDQCESARTAVHDYLAGTAYDDTARRARPDGGRV